jgi:hypothetical protein
LALALDHLVVAAATLDDGEDWLSRRLGCRLSPGGSHIGFGTHNRLVRLGPHHYLELIAPDPAQAGGLRKGTAAGTTLFGLDQPAVTEALAAGPRIIHLVFRVLRPGSLAAVVPRLRYDPGAITHMTRGDLAWDITIAPAGRLAGYGLLPTLIDWGDSPHPCTRLPENGLRLESIRIQGPDFVVAAFPLSRDVVRETGQGENGREPSSGAQGGETWMEDHEERDARITLAPAATPMISAGFRTGERRIIIQSALSIRELAR